MTAIAIYRLGRQYIALWQQPATPERETKIRLIRAIFEQWRQTCKAVHGKTGTK